jgi:hypothetical protein
MFGFRGFSLANASHGDQLRVMFGEEDRPMRVGSQPVFPEAHRVIQINLVISAKGGGTILQSEKPQFTILNHIR